MNSHLVSVVLPVHNGEKYLVQSIESILAQTYQNFELIIVNDCSTDSTEEIILKYKTMDERIVYVKNEVNSKLPKSLNNGFALARGEYYTWTSDDNLYHPDAIEKMVAYLETHSDIALVSCDYNEIDENGVFQRKIRVGKKPQLIYCNRVGACFMYTADTAKKIGGYAEDLFLVEDYEYWLRINLHFPIAFYHECLYEYRMHGGSLTETRKQEIWDALGKAHWRYLTEYEKLPMPDSELFDYFDFILRYQENAKDRLRLSLAFAHRHKKYWRRILQRAARRIHIAR